MPELGDILARVGKNKVLSKMDLSKGFQQIKVAENFREKTMFVPPIGRFRFFRKPFGLKKCPNLVSTDDGEGPRALLSDCCMLY